MTWLQQGFIISKTGEWTTRCLCKWDVHAIDLAVVLRATMHHLHNAHSATIDFEADVLRFIKLKDRGFGVPLTAIAHELSRDLEVRLTKQDLQPSVQRLIKEGKLAKLRAGVYRLSKEES